jgi:hypothetical protein
MCLDFIPIFAWRIRVIITAVECRRRPTRNIKDRPLCKIWRKTRLITGIYGLKILFRSAIQPRMPTPLPTPIHRALLRGNMRTRHGFFGHG